MGGTGGVVRELKGRGSRQFGKRSDPSRAAREAKRIKRANQKHTDAQREKAKTAGTARAQSAAFLYGSLSQLLPFLPQTRSRAVSVCESSSL